MEDINGKVIDLRNRVDFNTDRISKLEAQVVAIQDLTLSVQKLANNMEHMLAEQKKQREDIDAIKQEPARQWDAMKRTVFTTIAAAIAGAIVSGLVMTLSDMMQRGI